MFVGHRLQLATPSANPVCQDLEASFIFTKLPTSSFTATVSPGKPGHQLIRYYSFTTPTQAKHINLWQHVETEKLQIWNHLSCWIDGDCSDVSSGLHLSWWLLLHPQYWTQADMEWSKQGLQGKVQLCVPTNTLCITNTMSMRGFFFFLTAGLEEHWPVLRLKLTWTGCGTLVEGSLSGSVGVVFLHVWVNVTVSMVPAPHSLVMHSK